MVGVGGVPMGVSVGGKFVLPAPAVELREVGWVGGWVAIRMCADSPMHTNTWRAKVTMTT